MKHPLEKSCLLSLTLALALCTALAAAPQDRAPARTPGSGTFATNRYRNLFL